MRWTRWSFKTNRADDEVKASSLPSICILALFSYAFYLSFLLILGKFVTGDEPSLIVDVLPLVLGLFPAVLSFLFLRRTKTHPGLFVGVSTLTVAVASLVTYLILTRDCTPTACDDGIVWFLLSGIVILGLLMGVAFYKLAEVLG